MDASVGNLLTSYSPSLVTNASQALAIKVKETAPPAATQFNKWYSLKTIDHIPAYLLLGAGVAGIVIIVTASHFGNHLALGAGVLFTTSAFVGSYYCFKYTTMKPLIDLVRQLTDKVHEIDAVRIEIQAALKTYQDLERKLKGDNDTLGTLVDQESKVIATGKENIGKQTEEMERLVKRLKDAEEKLEGYQSLCDTFKGQINGLAQEVGAYNQNNLSLQKNISALNQNTDAVNAAEGEFKLDEGKLAQDNRQLEILARQFTALISNIRKDIALMQESHKRASEELEKQKALLGQIGQEIVGLQTATTAEEKTGAELADAAAALERKLKDLEIIVKLVPLLQVLVKQQSSNATNQPTVK